MNINFYWSPEPNSEDCKAIEREMSGMLQDRDIKPCHPGAISVLLGINKQLGNRLIGSAKCQCGKPLLKFEGSSASNLMIMEFE